MLCLSELGPAVPLQQRVKFVWSDYFYPLMKFFRHKGSGLVWDGLITVHWAHRRVPEWFDKYGNDVNHLFGPLESHLSYLSQK